MCKIHKIFQYLRALVGTMVFLMGFVFAIIKPYFMGKHHRRTVKYHHLRW